MPLDPTQAALVDDMKMRELQMKRKVRATDALLYRERRFRAVLLAIFGVLTAIVAALVIFEFLRRTLDREGWPPLAVAVIVLSVVAGVQIGKGVLKTRAGKRVLGFRERQLLRRYGGELASGRRWSQFYYKGEDIAPYVPQILYFLESDQRFSTVDEALEFAKRNRQANTVLAARAVKEFAAVERDGNLMVVASVGADGVPSARLMRYVRTETPGVWLVSTTADAPEVAEFDTRRTAIVTLPTPDGGSISSNRVRVSRAPFMLDAVADLFAEQIPGYLDGITEEQQRRELVYEVRFESARVDTWLDHDVVEFGDAE